jgi:hypothetical protein
VKNISDFMWFVFISKNVAFSAFIDIFDDDRKVKQAAFIFTRPLIC